MTDAEAAAAVLRQYLEALIAKDYATAGRLYNGKPADELRQWVEEQLQIRYLRVVSIGEPEPKRELGPRVFQVPFAVELEKDGAKEIAGPPVKSGPGPATQRKVTIRPVVGKPDRWVIGGDLGRNAARFAQSLCHVATLSSLPACVRQRCPINPPTTRRGITVPEPDPLPGRRQTEPAVLGRVESQVRGKRRSHPPWQRNASCLCGTGHIHPRGKLEPECHQHEARLVAAVTGPESERRHPKNCRRAVRPERATAISRNCSVVRHRCSPRGTAIWTCGSTQPSPRSVNGQGVPRAELSRCCSRVHRVRSGVGAVCCGSRGWRA